MIEGLGVAGLGIIAPVQRFRLRVPELELGAYQNRCGHL